MTTVEAFWEGCVLEPIACKYWLSRLREIDLSFVRSTLDQVPDHWISDTARDFAFAMLVSNSQRLIAVEDL